MEETKWEAAVKEEELKDGIPISVKLEKRNVLIVKTGGRIYSSSSKCPHYGAPLNEGVMFDHALTCPWHTSRFDLKTGQMNAPPALDDLTPYETKVENGMVYVKKGEKKQVLKPSAMTGEQFVIAGAGAAGTSAAMTLRRHGFSGKVIMLTEETDFPYDRPNLSKDFLTGEVKREWMDLNPSEFYERAGIEVWRNHKVMSMNLEKKALTFAHGVDLAYDKILLATGGIPRTPEVPGIDFPGFFLLRSFSDAQSIVQALEKSPAVVVLGASFIGLEVAASLRARGLEVHVVAPETVPMARVFGDRIGSYVKQVHVQKGVRFHLGVTAQKIGGKDKVRKVVLSDGSSVQSEVVIAGIGIVPAVGYLEDTGLVVNGAVPVDGTLRTKKEGVYAAGDIAVVPDSLGKTSRRIEHWVEAQRQGQHAALSMLGIEKEYCEVPFFWTKQYDMSIKYVGYVKSADAISYRGSVEEGDFIAGYYERGRLKAAAGIGRPLDIIILSEILKAGMSVKHEEFGDEGKDLREHFTKKQR